MARSTDWLASLGGRVSGARLDRARESPQWSGKRFQNAQATYTMRPGEVAETLRREFAGEEIRYPRRPIPVEPRQRSDFEAPPSSGLRVTWFGHATALLEIDGLRVLTDPVWSKRVSPSSLLGPARFFEPPIALEDLPAIDAVLVSHDHYDHLDMETVRVLARRGAIFLVPLGIGAHLERWRVPVAQIRELDWGEETALDGVSITATPARHFAGRRIGDGDATLWSSWVIAGPSHRVFYSGDSGYFEGFREIGRAYGPFDLTLMSAGAYGPTWPLIHMTPEEVVQAHLDVGGGLLVPIHWGTFNLAFHDWNEPAVRVAAAAQSVAVPLSIPQPGQMLEPASPPPLSVWWRER